MGEKGLKLVQEEVVLDLLKNLVINFFRICSLMKIYIICHDLHKSHIRETSGSWDMGKNTLAQSDYRIFKSTISSEQNDEIGFFACLYKSMKMKSWLKWSKWVTGL